MTTENKVSEYLKEIGAEYSNVQIIKEHEAICNIQNADQFIGAIKNAHFTQYDYNEKDSKEDMGASVVENQYFEKHYFQHNNLNAYIMVVEYPSNPEKNYAYLSNEPVVPKHWLTLYIESLNLPTKEEVLINVAIKAYAAKTMLQSKFEEIKSKFYK